MLNRLNKAKMRAATYLGTSMAVVSGAASAALPLGISTGIDAIEVDALALFDLVWPLIIAITSAMIIVKIFKRVITKA